MKVTPSERDAAKEQQVVDKADQPTEEQGAKPADDPDNHSQPANRP
jgi:hypothetical protein